MNFQKLNRRFILIVGGGLIVLFILIMIWSIRTPPSEQEPSGIVTVAPVDSQGDQNTVIIDATSYEDYLIVKQQQELQGKQAIPSGRSLRQWRAEDELAGKDYVTYEEDKYKHEDLEAGQYGYPKE